jgi:hypothetical protein
MQKGRRAQNGRLFRGGEGEILADSKGELKKFY